MSKGYHHTLWNAINKDDRDKYKQRVIDQLDDPEYEGVPIIIDAASGHMFIPGNMEDDTLMRILQETMNKLLERS